MPRVRENIQGRKGGGEGKGGGAGAWELLHEVK